MADFEFVPHTADIALRACAPDFPTLLRTAALGLSAAIVGREDLDPYRAPGVAPRLLESEDAPDEEGLLVSFLNEVIYQGEVNGEVYTDFEVLEWAPEKGVRARAYPNPSLEAVLHVKAATYYDLRVSHSAQGVEATVVFDV